jgi:hypothetical protein
VGSVRSFNDFLKAKDERPALAAIHHEVYAYLVINSPHGVSTAAVAERFFGGDRREAKKHLDPLKEQEQVRKAKYVRDAV